MTSSSLTRSEIIEGINQVTKLSTHDNETYSEAHFAIASKRVSDNKFSVGVGSIYPKGNQEEINYTFNHSPHADLESVSETIQSIRPTLQNLNTNGDNS